MQLPPGSPDLETAKRTLHERYDAVEMWLLQVVDTLAKSGFADQRWCAIARTHFEEGAQALHRALRTGAENAREYGKIDTHVPLPPSFTPAPDPSPERNAGEQAKLVDWKDVG